MAGEMRQAMPTVAAFIDDLRAAFGEEEVTGWIREGMRTGRFYASEGGVEIGQPWIGEGVVATVISLPAEPPTTGRKRR